MTKRMLMAIIALVGLMIGVYLTLYKYGVVGELACSVGSCGVALALLLLTGWGVVFSSWLTYLEWRVINAWCQWCVISAVLVAVLFLLALSDWRGQRQIVRPA